MDLFFIFILFFIFFIYLFFIYSFIYFFSRTHGKQHVGREGIRMRNA